MTLVEYLLVQVPSVRLCSDFDMRNRNVGWVAYGGAVLFFILFTASQYLSVQLSLFSLPIYYIHSVPNTLWFHNEA